MPFPEEMLCPPEVVSYDNGSVDIDKASQSRHVKPKEPKVACSTGIPGWLLFGVKGPAP